MHDIFGRNPRRAGWLNYLPAFKKAAKYLASALEIAPEEAMLEV
jgi:hypothetical protein